MEIKAWNFAKRENSTLQPDNDNPGKTFEAVLKASTSIINPVLKVTDFDDSMNYFSIPEFDRYYFITDIVHVNSDICEVYGKVDTLASHKGAILNTNAYVLRATKENDIRVTDAFYPSKAGTTQKENHAHFIPLINPGFIISVMGIDEDAISTFTGAVTYYIVSETALANLIKFIFNQDNFAEEITDKVVKTFFNPSQYLVSCMYCPFLSGTGGSTIKVGWWDTGIIATQADAQPVKIDDIAIPIPRPNSDANHYLNYEPYSNYRIYIPYVGMQGIASNLLYGAESLVLSGYVDIPTGNMQLKLKGNLGKTIATYEANCCSALPLAQSSMPLNEFTAIAGGAGIIGDAFSSLGSFGKNVSDMLDSISTASRQVSINGSSGQMSQRQFESNVILFCDYYEQVEKDNEDHGSPLCKVRTLSALSGGFVKCLGAHFSNTVANYTECREIENYMNGGMYIE